MVAPSRPRSRIWSISARGYSSRCSSSEATGITSLLTKRRTSETRRVAVLGSTVIGLSLSPCERVGVRAERHPEPSYSQPSPLPGGEGAQRCSIQVLVRWNGQELHVVLSQCHALKDRSGIHEP